MWHAPSKVNRLQCVDRRTDACTMQRRLEWKAKQLVRRQTSRLRLQNSARVGTNVNRCVCVCACVCVRLRRRLRVPANKKKKKLSFHLFISCEKRRDCFLERGTACHLSIFESRYVRKGCTTKRTGTEMKTFSETTKKFRFGCRVSFGAGRRHLPTVPSSAHAVVCKHHSIYNYMCLREEEDERHYEPLNSTQLFPHHHLTL